MNTFMDLKKHLLLVLSIFLYTTAANAATVAIGFNQGAFNSAIGNQFNVGIVGNYGGPETLAGGGFNLYFDATKLQLNSVSISPEAGDFSYSNGIIDNNSGSAQDIGFASFWGLSGDFSIATLNFSVIGGGISQLLMSDSGSDVYTWTNYDYSAGPFGDSVTPIFSSASVSAPTAVPLPASGVMAFSSILSLLFFKKRK
jgi:hypothetical protein